MFRGKREGRVSHDDRMKMRIDSDEVRRIVAARFACVGPVFDNLRGNKHPRRFMLRGKSKVGTRCKLSRMVRVIEKLAHHA